MNRRLVSVLLSLAIAPAALAQTTATLPAPAPAPLAAPIPADAVPVLAPSTIPAASAPATSAPAATRPAGSFVGTILSDRVYVRSGPAATFYELGQLSKGDLVNVISTRQGWYQITPPAGAFCYIGKDLVDADADGKTGTVKADYVNVRAASALHPLSDYAVLHVLRKGTKLNILGTGGPSEKYYKIPSPANALVYVNPQFVKAAPVGTEYTAATLRLPNGAANPTTLAAAPIVTTEPSIVQTPVTATQEAEANPVPVPQTQPRTVFVAPQPAVTFNADARAKFNQLNEKLTAEFKKPLLERKLDGFLQDFKDLHASPNLAPSLKSACEQYVAAIQKTIAIQDIAKENDDSHKAALQEQTQGLEKTWAESQKEVAKYEQTGPYLAEGVLKTSEAVKSKPLYVLVNPATGRVTAYVDPASPGLDLSKLLGQYVGVRGSTDTPAGLSVSVITVKNATIMPAPAKTSAD